MTNYSSLENKNYMALLKTISNSLFKSNHTFEEDIDWEAVFAESCKQAVCSLSFDGIGKNVYIPTEISEKWFGFASSYMRNNAEVNANHDYLDGFMNKHKIPYCILKGAASEYYYPNPILRAMGDVDFLVPKEYFEQATKLLINEGFEMTGEEHICHRVFTKNRMHLEMHFEPAGMPEGENRKNTEHYFSDIFEKASSADLEGISFVNPSEFHHGLVMLLHTYHHLLSEGIGLRHLCDWAVFVNSFNNEEFCSIFEEKLFRLGLWRFAQILSATSCNYLGLPYRDWIGEIDEELTANVICDIFEGGNFGNKDQTRIQEGHMISDRGKDGVKNPKLLQLIKIKNKQAKEIFSIIGKIPVFYHFGFIFLGIRYLFHVLIGKRNALDIKKISVNAEKRKNIYSKFELFEKGD